MMCRADGEAARVVVLSPHADDAAWSLGGLLNQLGLRAHMVTIYDGDPPDWPSRASEAAFEVPDVPNAWRAQRGTARRRTEDVRAAALLGVSLQGLGEPDAAFRRDERGGFEHAALDNLFPSYERLKALPAPVWLERLAALIEKDDLVLAPMAFGRHVDHYLTLAAARELAPDRLLLYAEFPYWERAAENEAQAHLAALDLHMSMNEVAVPWDAWCAAASAYRSQVLRLFGSRVAFVERLERFADRRGTQASCAIWSSRSL